MATKIEAFIKPELLVWARESSGYTLIDAARKIGIPSDKLDAWEKGTSRPSIQQLQKIAKIYKRPLAVFYLSEPPKTFDPMRDFRRLSPYGETKKSPVLLYEIRKAYQKRDVAIEMSELLNEAVVDLDLAVDIGERPERAAQKIRNHIGLSMEAQMKAKNSNEALNLWRESIEELGVLVFQTNSRSRIPLREMRGFSISQRPYPVIVLNSSDSPNGKIFTLIHEFIHLLLNAGGICDLDDQDGHDSEEQKTEFFCNMTAGAILVPQGSFFENSMVRMADKEKYWSNEELGELADKYSVSAEVILRRLLIFGKTTANFYKQKRSEYLKIEEKKKSGFAPFHRLVVRDNGPFYTKLILNAYRQEIITASNLSDYLGTKLKHLYDIERDVSMIQTLGAA
jgi:Zn-dependent peptidase ImmA (M78 family)/DNA-binding XRE family transcriptional regulator